MNDLMDSDKMSNDMNDTTSHTRTVSEPVARMVRKLMALCDRTEARLLETARQSDDHRSFSGRRGRWSSAAHLEGEAVIVAEIRSVVASVRISPSTFSHPDSHIALFHHLMSKLDARVNEALVVQAQGACGPHTMDNYSNTEGRKLARDAAFMNATSGWATPVDDACARPEPAVTAARFRQTLTELGIA